MKAVLCLAVALGFATSDLFTSTVLAQFSYTTNNSGTIIIRGYTGPSGGATIPATIDSLPVTEIGDGAFVSCTNLTSVSMPSTLTRIGSWAFLWCTNLTGVTIPESVTSIGDGAFFFCFGLASLAIPAGVTNLGDGTFHCCTSLTSLSLPNRVTRIGNNAFSGCTSLTNLIIPESVTSIGDKAFECCLNLTNLVIPSSVTNVGEYAFAESGLVGIAIPSRIACLNEGMFFKCTNLVSITIPDGVTEVGTGAFAYCTRLMSIRLPSSLMSIGKAAFHCCTSLTAIQVDSLNSQYASVEGVLFDKSQATLLQFPGGKSGNYRVPGSVSTIGEGAFYACSCLSNVTLSRSVTSIGDCAFWGCTGLVGVYCEGNAPDLSWISCPPFLEANCAIVYYLPGTAGWGPSYGERPTALWFLPKPLILTGDSSFGVRTNALGFVVSWATNASVVVEVATNLVISGWVPVSTNSLTNGLFYWSDPRWAQYPSRFYRIRAR